MEQKTYSFDVKIADFEKVNSQFAKVKVYVLYTGRNRNYSDMSKQVVENALYSLKNIPVIGEWKNENNNFGGHGGKLEISDDGIEWIDTTRPYGVVPSDTEINWETVKEKDGLTEHEYLTCTAYLWYKRYPELEKVLNDGSNQSMEVNVLNYHMDEDGYAVFDEMEFSALCVLGKDSDPQKNVEPCFEGSKVTNYSFDKDKFKQDFTDMIKELKYSLQDQSSFEVDNINLNKKEVDNIVNEKLELIAKYNLSVEQLNFSIDEMPLEELEGKLKEFLVNKNLDATSFSATYRQKREALDNALDPIIIKNNEGRVIDETYYWINDFDDEYVYVERNHWTENNHESDNGRFTYTFDQSNLTATITSEFEKMIFVWLTEEENQKIQDERANSIEEFEKLKCEFEEYKNKYSTPNEEVVRLQEFETSTLFSQRETLFSQFDAQLTDNEEYQTLKQNASQFSLEQLEKEVAFIIVKSGTNVKFSSNKGNKKQNQTVKLPFSSSHSDGDSKVYGDLFEKYLPKRD